jgi:gamma-glutamyltranspeptidase/glutathione hydrolase
MMTLGVIDFDLDLEAATAAPRLHHPWLPDIAKYESRGGSPTDETLAALRALGHKLEVAAEQGSTCSIHVLKDGTYHGVADPRRYEGKAAGW